MWTAETAEVARALLARPGTAAGAQLGDRVNSEVERFEGWSSGKQASGLGQRPDYAFAQRSRISFDPTLSEGDHSLCYQLSERIILVIEAQLLTGSLKGVAHASEHLGINERPFIERERGLKSRSSS